MFGGRYIFYGYKFVSSVLKGGCNLIYVETFEIYEEVEKTIVDKCM